MICLYLRLLSNDLVVVLDFYDDWLSKEVCQVAYEDVNLILVAFLKWNSLILVKIDIKVLTESVKELLSILCCIMVKIHMVINDPFSFRGSCELRKTIILC